MEQDVGQLENNTTKEGKKKKKQKSAMEMGMLR